jgi:hypothetical protein
MIRSALAFAALLALAASSTAAFACPDHMQVTNDSKQTVATVDGKSSKPIIVPNSQKDG